MSNEAVFQERQELIRRAVALEPVDRVPLVYMGVAFSPRYMGMSIAEFCHDPDAAVEVTLAAMDRLGGFDAINGVPLGYQTTNLSMLWLSRLAIPGEDLPEDSLWQVHEAEMMTVEDYDTIIEKGWKPFLEFYLPRVIDPEKVARQRSWVATNAQRIFASFRDRGYVVFRSGITTIPFECFCGGRSMQKFVFDLHRIPDKVQAAMDAIMPDLIQGAIQSARTSGIPSLWVGGWRSASALISPRLWNRFVFPYLLDLVGKLIENGITPVLHLDQDWTRDLARFRELPARKCVLNLDGATDVRKTKEVLGDHMAILGDVPASLFAAGMPEDVRAYVRDLIRDVGPTGLLLCPGCDAPINTRPENMEAFAAAAREFGRVN